MQWNWWTNGKTTLRLPGVDGKDGVS
jgi:hypothetical protein